MNVLMNTYTLILFKNTLLRAIFLFSATGLMAQKEVLWFGTYTDEAGKVRQGRYHIALEGKALTKVELAPYGRPSIAFNIIKNDTIQRFVELSWPNKPQSVATLIQYGEGYYAGNFEDGTNVYPIVIKAFNFQDAQLQGNWFAPSAIEVEIIATAMELLSTEKQWNRHDDRICTTTTGYSLFCALYEASIRVDGEYRHLRPAIKFVREAIQERYPKKYEHVLVDFNNAEEISLKEVQAILLLARQRLLEEMN